VHEFRGCYYREFRSGSQHGGGQFLVGGIRDGDRPSFA
jgi:hypothetical protein